jgi:hypothetical protein
MNLRTTLVLAVLAVAGVGIWLIGPRLPERLSPVPLAPPRSDAGTLEVFEKDITPERTKSIEISRAGEPVLALERGGKDTWVLPGGWPTRDDEIKELVNRLTTLRSRFAPLPLPEDKQEREKTLRRYGLAPAVFTVLLHTEETSAKGSEVKKTTYKLFFGEGETEDDENGFFRPVYVRLGDRPEVVRLGPGLLALLDRPRDYYRKRQLFPTERVARSASPGDKGDRVKRLQATQVEVEDRAKKSSFTLAEGRKGWQLTRPTVDRVDPDARDRLLEGFAELWAERFVPVHPFDVAGMVGTSWQPLDGASWAGLATSHDWLLKRTGLDKPERTVRVVHEGGDLTLLIGGSVVGRSRSAEPASPDASPPPVEEFSYARLKQKAQTFDQVFEVRSDRLKDIVVSVDTLRDKRLARFENKDVRKVEVRHGSEKLALSRDDKDKWQVDVSSAPAAKAAVPADEGKVNELLDRLSTLSAQEKEGDAPMYGASVAGLLASPAAGPALAAAALSPGRLPLTESAPGTGPVATVVLTLQEEDEKDAKGGKKEPKQLELTVLARNEASKQLAVRVDDWPRAHLVDDGVLSLMRRPDLAYRGKLFNFGPSELEQVVIDQKGGKKVALTQTASKWSMTVPAVAPVDAAKATQLADTLVKLEPVEYLSEDAKPAELESKYGLGKTALAVTVQAKGKLRTLRIGKQREKDKQEFYARLDEDPSLFVVSSEVHDALLRDSLSYLPLELWHVTPESVQGLRVQKKGAEPFVVERQGKGWKLTRPFATPALDEAVKPIVDVLASPHCERYETHTAANLKTYGLDQPSLRVEVIAKGDKQPNHTLLVGLAVKDGSRDRFAKIEGSSAVCVLRGDVVRTIDPDPLTLVDTLLLNVNLDKVDRIQSKKGAARLVLQQDGGWKVTEAPGAPYAADTNAINSLRATLFNLRAERFAAYDSKPKELKKYGFESPFATVTLSVEEGGKKTLHTLELGAEVEGQPGQRYLRLDKGPGVAVLSPADARTLARTHLDYVDHRLLAFEADKVTAVQRQKGSEALELAKQQGEWQIVKPEMTQADDGSVENLVRQLSALRAADIAEYPLKEAKKYGLDTPFAVVTVQGTGADGKPVKHTLTLGNEVPGKKGERYCRADSASVVATLAEAQVQRLAAGPLAYRNREVARFGDADKILLERGQRKATLAKAGGTWSMTVPLETKVDHDAVEEFLGKAARLKVDEFIAEKPTDLKEYGLDRPVVRWRFQEGGKDVLDLLVGKAEPSGRRRYAKLGGGGLVFLLDFDMSGRVVSEFRDKTVSSMPLDAAQVETLRVTHGSKTLVLKREGSDWVVEGKPEAKPLAETVNDTLAALTGLKLDHYAVDKGADFKLFDLDPPEVSVEAQMGERKMTLYLGHFEGESKQRYARVPEKDRSDVFVLSGEDSLRLTRDLAAFMKPLPKKPPPPFGGPMSP